MKPVCEPNRGHGDSRRESFDMATVNIDHLLSLIPDQRALSFPVESSASNISLSDDVLTPDLDMSVFLQDPDDQVLDGCCAHAEESRGGVESGSGPASGALACNKYMRHVLDAFSSTPTYLLEDKAIATNPALRRELCSSKSSGASGAVPETASAALLSFSTPPMALAITELTTLEANQRSVALQLPDSAQTNGLNECAFPIQNSSNGSASVLDNKFYLQISGAGQAGSAGGATVMHPNSHWTTGQHWNPESPAAENSVDTDGRDVSLDDCQGLTDEELLRLKPKKLRKRARFDKPIPSRFCHVCSRTPKNVRLAVCCNISDGVCRKVVCERCFVEYGYGGFDDAFKMSDWECPHCTGACPARAQCRTYSRINDRLRVTRLKQPKKQIRRKRGANDEAEALPGCTQVTRATDPQDSKIVEPKFQHILPAPSNGTTVADFLTYIFNEPVVQAPDDPLKSDIAGDLLRSGEHLI